MKVVEGNFGKTSEKKEAKKVLEETLEGLDDDSYVMVFVEAEDGAFELRSNIPQREAFFTVEQIRQLLIDLSFGGIDEYEE